MASPGGRLVTVAQSETRTLSSTAACSSGVSVNTAGLSSVS